MGRMPEYDVLATGQDMEPRFSGGSCGYTRLDITDQTAVERIFDDFAPDVVINCAAMTQVDQCETEKEACWQINAVAVELLSKACLKTGARLVQISTDFVFDGEDGPYRENARPSPLSYYGRSKLAGENYARGAGTNKWSIVRTVLVYGVAENAKRSNFVVWLRTKLEAGEPVRIVTDQWRTPTYVVDLASAIERLVRFKKHGVFHVSGRENMSVHDFALLIAEALNLDKNLISPADASSFSQVASRPAKSGFIILKAETELGFKPHSSRDAILEIDRRISRYDEAS